MAGTRVQIDLFYKDKTPKQIEKEFPNLLPSIKALKAKATKINAGHSNEEITIIAKYHICHHDEPDNQISCSDTEQEI